MDAKAEADLGVAKDPDAAAPAISVANAELPDDDQPDEAASVAPEELPPPPPELAEPDPEASAKDEKERIRAQRGYLLRRFWYSAKQFWGKDGYRWAWALTFGVFVLILLNLAAQYGINRWNRNIFDELEKKNSHAVFQLSLLIFPLAAASVACGVANVFVRMGIQRTWRGWLQKRVIDRWLNHGRYYQLNLVSGDHDNPEYRIAQDLRVATDAPVDFAVGVVGAALSAATFITVLWTIGGALDFKLGGANIYIPGFLVVAAIVYAALTSGLMALIGRRFVAVSEGVNQSEADYRYVLTRVRENGESIALLGGEEEERLGLDRSFKQVLKNWRDLCGQHMRTTIVSQGSNLIAPVIPIILCAPKFLEGSMTLGMVMQAVSAFTIVQNAFGWLVDNYPRLADWSASARRVASLLVSLDALERAETGDGMGRIQHAVTDKKQIAIRLKDLSVTLDDGTAVIDDAEVVIEQGERVLVAGESGTGKSTLVRAISGLWPWGGGEIAIRDGAKLFLLPQRPYVPTGTLRRAAAYPAPEANWSLEEIQEAFKQCGLEHLVDRIEDTAPWDQTLSGGEKQRLAFVRLFLHQPDIIVFDEATSALDPESQDTLMKLVSERLKDATVVSVGHRPELEQFHNRKIILERRRGSARFVSDVHLVDYLEKGKRTGKLVRRLLKGQRKASGTAA